MFDNAALDVAIGLIFIFLIYSLLASILLEIIAKMFGLRSRNLLRGIRRMLQDETTESKQSRFTLWAWLWEFGRDFYYYFKPIEKDTLLDQFYKAPTIRYLGENSVRSKPPYIYANTFSQTLIQLFRTNSFDSRTQSESQRIFDVLKRNELRIDPDTLLHFQNLFEDARHDVVQFRINMEKWFDETMERATGWYVRQSQIILFWIGLGLALAFNIDSVAIVKILLQNDDAREELVQLATSRQEQYGRIITRLEQNKTDTTGVAQAKQGLKENRQLLDSLRNDGQVVENLLGLGPDCLCGKESEKPKVVSAKGLNHKKKQIIATPKIKPTIGCPPQPYCLIGWLLTAMAISLGAPFWYDILCKLISIRPASQKSDPVSARTNSSTQPPIVG